jgi:hypothetical protein
MTMNWFAFFPCLYADPNTGGDKIDFFVNPSQNQAGSTSTANDCSGWAVVEWECCLKHPEDGAREGAQFVSDHIIRVTERAFHDFADGGTDEEANRKMLGIVR